MHVKKRNLKMLTVKLATETSGEKKEGLYALKFSTPVKSFPIFMWLGNRSV